MGYFGGLGLHLVFCFRVALILAGSGWSGRWALGAGPEGREQASAVLGLCNRYSGIMHSLELCGTSTCRFIQRSC